jgi:acetoin utilization deacetylase AcuC-like enzyme
MGNTLGLVTSEKYFYHQSRIDFGPDVEPGADLETPAPRRRLLNLIRKTGAYDECVALTPIQANTDDLLRIHSQGYVSEFKTLSDTTGGELGDYAGFGPGAFEIAALSAGGVMEAALAVARGTVRRSFALVRPPGHHAERDRARGFCLFANIPIAIERLRAEGLADRIVVIDWDVHHGNGAQSIYYHDPNVLTISIHQEQLYPADSGFVNELGIDAGFGFNLNIPLPSGGGVGIYRYAFETVIEPAVRSFQPDIVFVACGYDAGILDPSSQMALPASGFTELTNRVIALAEDVADGRLVFAQEGGYSELHSPLCGASVVHALLEKDIQLVDHYAVTEESPEQRLLPHQIEAVNLARSAASASGLLRSAGQR